MSENSVYVKLSEGVQHHTRQVPDFGGDIMVDVDERGQPIGIEVLGALDVTVDGESVLKPVKVAHEACSGEGIVLVSPGTFGPEPEPPESDLCWGCAGTGEDAVAKTIANLIEQNEYLLGRLAFETVMRRVEEGSIPEPKTDEEILAAAKWPVYRERMASREPDHEGLLISHGRYREIARRWSP
jgi:uncharacterized protein YuzE